MIKLFVWLKINLKIYATMVAFHLYIQSLVNQLGFINIIWVFCLLTYILQTGSETSATEDIFAYFS